MDRFLIKRVPDGAYVAKPGSASSYTRSIKHARKYPTRDAANADRCEGNEIVVTTEEESD